MPSKISKIFVSILLAMQLASGGGVALPGGGSPVIGKIILSSRASVDEVQLRGQGTLLDNDHVRTQRNGRAVVDFPESVRAALGEETQVRFRISGGQLVADLAYGEVTTLKQEQAGLRIETAEYTFEPKGGGRALFKVTMQPGRSTTVAAVFGSTLITERATGQRYELQEGKYASVSAAATGFPAAPDEEKEASKPAPEHTPTPVSAPPPKPPWHIGSMSPGASAAVVAGVVGGGIAGTAAALSGGGGGAGTVSPTQ